MALYQAQRHEDAIPEFRRPCGASRRGCCSTWRSRIARPATRVRPSSNYDRYLSSEPKLDNEMQRKGGWLSGGSAQHAGGAGAEDEAAPGGREKARGGSAEPAPSTVAPPDSGAQSGSLTGSPTAVSPTAASDADDRPPAEPAAIGSARRRPSRVSPVYRRWWFWTAIGVNWRRRPSITGGLATRSTGYPAVLTAAPRVTLMF